MKRKLITCPETTYFEVIEYERTPLGTLIVCCSRLERCDIECARTCATRMDEHTETFDDSYPGPDDQLPSEHA